jgi:hypothetical protein
MGIICKIKNSWIKFTTFYIFKCINYPLCLWNNFECILKMYLNQHLIYNKKIYILFPTLGTQLTIMSFVHNLMPIWLCPLGLIRWPPINKNLIIIIVFNISNYHNIFNSVSFCVCDGGFEVWGKGEAGEARGLCTGFTLVTYNKRHCGCFSWSFFHHVTHQSIHPSVCPIIHPWMTSYREKNLGINK